jgi:putative transposase
MMVVQAHRFALDPSSGQERALRSHAGAARFAWNWALAQCRERYKSEGRWYSAAELHRLWNRVKKADPALAWWAENSKCVYQEAFRDLDRALRDFVRSKNRRRRGRLLGFPRFKKRGQNKDSFRFSTGAIGCSGSRVTLPRLGTIHTHESTRKLARRLEAGTARILSVTVSRTAQRWYVSFTVEVDRAVPEEHAQPGSVIGIDLGIKTLLTGVDDRGHVITIVGPKALRADLRGLRRAGRAYSRAARGGANRRKRAERLARMHARVTNVRADAMHKATTALARQYETVVCEDLNVVGMLTNRRLARAVADAGFGAARRMLAYKTARHGGQLLAADRWYPSSKTCSACGTAKAKLCLSERTFTCDNCGHTEDRDVNAAHNLLNLAASGAESQNACRLQVRPGAAGHRGKTQEPGATAVGKTGTAGPQGRAASQQHTPCS